MRPLPHLSAVWPEFGELMVSNTGKETVTERIPGESIATASRPEEFRIGDRPSPSIDEAFKAFRRDLPQLLREHPREWVAYHGDRSIGCGRSQVDLYESCLRRGYAEGEFLVHCVVGEPETFDLKEFQNK
jgi:hypothetical protein